MRFILFLPSTTLKSCSEYSGQRSAKLFFCILVAHGNRIEVNNHYDVGIIRKIFFDAIDKLVTVHNVYRGIYLNVSRRIIFVPVAVYRQIVYSVYAFKRIYNSFYSINALVVFRKIPIPATAISTAMPQPMYPSVSNLKK